MDELAYDDTDDGQEDLTPVRQFAKELARFDWALYLFSVVLFCWSQYTLWLTKPYATPFFANDATRWYTPVPSTIPYWLVAYGMPFALIPLVMALEFLLGNLIKSSIARGRVKPRSMLQRATIALRFGLAILTVGLLASGTADLTKFATGELRPGFARSCLESVPPSAYQPLVITSNEQCTNAAADNDELDSARVSFPSGHTLMAFCWSLSTAVYLFNVALILGRERLRSRLIANVMVFVALCLMAWAWAVGITRIRDFHHHPWDVLTGAFLGTMCTAVGFVPTLLAIRNDYAPPTVY